MIDANPSPITAVRRDPHSLESTRPVERDIAVTMRPRGGLPVRLERRAA